MLKIFGSKAKGFRVVAILTATLCITAGRAEVVDPTAFPPTSARSESEHATITGLNKPARIIIDHWGIPHIYAQNLHDAFFVQGYNAARDRLWQIDLWRKRGLGLLAKSFGSAYVEQDRAARLFLYNGDMAAEWAAYGPGARSIATAFVEGVNAYVSAVRSGHQKLPLEFRITHSQPDYWKPEDVVRIRSNALASNVVAEVIRARVVCQSNAKESALIWPLEPKHTLSIPEGLDPCTIPINVLRDYQLATAPVIFRKPPNGDRASLDGLNSLGAPRGEGSNAWVISPSRSKSGRAILANDPHRALADPSLRYIAHLNAPGLDVIGAGEPALPGISLGHNQDIAWGLTIFDADQQDLVVSELNKSEPSLYRGRNGWTSLKNIQETIEVRGGPSQLANLQFTEEGPVLAVDQASGHVFSLRSVWTLPGSAAYYASIGTLRAENWDDFISVRDRWGVPPLNLLYADVRGNIGWAAAAFVPVRNTSDGLLPIPGGNQFEWHGLLPGRELPSSYNPQRGWFASANEMNLPGDYPAHRVIAFEWANRARIDRINAVLQNLSSAGLEDMASLQNDVHNVFADRAVALLKGLTSPDPQTSSVLKTLQDWDGNEDTRSVAAAIYEVWTSHYLRAALAKILATPTTQKLIASGSLDVALANLEHPDDLGPNPIEIRNNLILLTLGQAAAELRSKFGDDISKWTWGSLHVMRFVPAIAAIASEDVQSKLATRFG